MHTPLQTTVIALLLTTASLSAQAQTTPPPEVIEPDGICTQITIPDPDNPAPATIEVNDDTDPDCHTPGIIYQQAPDSQIDVQVDATATDWATACRALGVTVGPLAQGHGGPEPHTFETTTRTRVLNATTTRCVTVTLSTRDDGRRDRTVYDCREAGAHTSAAGDGHAHEWLTEPWEAWNWTEVARWADVDTTNCPEDTGPSETINLNPVTETNDPPNDPPGGGEDPTGVTENTGTPDTTEAPAQPTATYTMGALAGNSISLAVNPVTGEVSVISAPHPAQSLTGTATSDNDGGNNDDGGIDGFSDGGWTDGNGFGVPCFNETAQVETANGTTRSAIEIRIGDTLRTQTGTATVRAVYHDTRAKHWVAINGETPFVTATHPIVTARGLVKGRDLKSGDRVQKSDGTWMEVTTIEIRPIEQTSVNIETANDEAYVVNGLWFGSYGTYAME